METEPTKREQREGWREGASRKLSENIGNMVPDLPKLIASPALHGPLEWVSRGQTS